jgi:hypothetical protein
LSLLSSAKRRSKGLCLNDSRSLYDRFLAQTFKRNTMVHRMVDDLVVSIDTTWSGGLSSEVTVMREAEQGRLIPCVQEGV